MTKKMWKSIFFHSKKHWIADESFKHNDITPVHVNTETGRYGELQTFL